MKDTAAARRYAKAAIESAENIKQIKQMRTELLSFSEIFSRHPELKKILHHPGIKMKNKKGIISEIARKMSLSEKCGKVLEIVLENGRIAIIPEIAQIFSELTDEKLRWIKVHVASARPLSENEEKKLEEVFTTITGKSARVEVEVDKSLIGGIVARMGSKVYDGSLINQLRLLKVKLQEEA